MRVPDAAGSTACLLQESDQGTDSQLEVLQTELFVGCMDVVVGKAEAHHHAGKAQVAIEVADDGNGAAGTDKDGVFAPDFMQCVSGGLDVLVVNRNETRVTGVNEAHLHVNAGRRDLFDVVLVLGEGFRRSHAGDEAHGNFGNGLGGDNGFGSSPNKASGDAMDVEGGTCPGALKNAVATFADELARTYFGDAVLLFVEGQALPRGEFFWAGRNDVVVEAGDEDVAVGVFQTGDDLRDGGEWVGGRTAVHTRVEIGLGASDFEFGVDHAPQADAECGQTGSE